MLTSRHIVLAIIIIVAFLGSPLKADWLIFGDLTPQNASLVDGWAAIAADIHGESSVIVYDIGTFTDYLSAAYWTRVVIVTDHPEAWQHAPRGCALDIDLSTFDAPLLWSAFATESSGWWACADLFWQRGVAYTSWSEAYEGTVTSMAAPMQRLEIPAAPFPVISLHAHDMTVDATGSEYDECLQRCRSRYWDRVRMCESAYIQSINECEQTYPPGDPDGYECMDDALRAYTHCLTWAQTLRLICESRCVVLYGHRQPTGPQAPGGFSGLP